MTGMMTLACPLCGLRFAARPLLELHMAVAEAACAAARRAGVPVLAHTTCGVPGAWMIDLGPDAVTARTIQKAAAAAHESQSPVLPELIRRLNLLDSQEHLRWLARPEATGKLRAGSD